MDSNDITDLIAGYALFFVMIIVVSVGGLEFAGHSFTSKDIRFSDDERLFLLNYLRTDGGDGEIADMIALNENGDLNTLKNLQDASKKILNFYGPGWKNYILKVQYPNGNVKFITASREWDLPSAGTRVESGFEELKKFWFELGNGQKIKIPSINNGLITVELEVEDE